MLKVFHLLVKFNNLWLFKFIFSNLLQCGSPLCIVFLDIKYCFDTVSVPQSFWSILSKSVKKWRTFNLVAY